jgi:hypothetical protein
MEMNLTHKSFHRLTVVAASFFILSFIIVFLNCQKEPSLPAQPTILDHAADTLYAGSGIGTVPEGDWIQIQWLANTESHLAGYKIFRFTYDDNVTQTKITMDALVADIAQPIPLPETLAWIDKSVQLDTRYYYYLQAYDTQGNTSVRSAMVNYKLINKISPTKLTAPRSACYITRPIFTFGDLTADISINNILVKVYDVNTQSIIWVSERLDPFNGNGVLYNYNGKATQDTLANDHNYKWRVDAFGRDINAGSESQWIDFTVTAN